MNFFLLFSTMIIINTICILPTLLDFFPFSFLFFFFRILDKSVLRKEGLALVYSLAVTVHYSGEDIIMGEQRADMSHGIYSQEAEREREMNAVPRGLLAHFPLQCRLGSQSMSRVGLPSSPSTDEMTVN